MAGRGKVQVALWPIHQCALTVFTQPAVHDVGVDAVLQRQPTNGRAGAYFDAS
jgi:hypothetical protein